MKRRVACGLGALLLTWSSAVLSDPVSREAEQTLSTRYVGDAGITPMELGHGQDDNFWMLRDQLDYRVTAPDFSVGARLELTMFPGAPAYNDQSFSIFRGTGESSYLLFDNDFRLERLFVEYRWEEFRIRLGDMPLTLGRSILLHLDTAAETGVDNALRGAAVEWTRGPWTVRAAGGVVNASNMDPLTLGRLEDDPLDALVALSADLRIREAAAVGVQGLLLEPRFRSAADVDTPDRLWVDQGPGVSVAGGGIHFDLRLGGVRFYLEADGQAHRDFRANGAGAPAEPGFAQHADISWDSGPRFHRMGLLLRAENIVCIDWLVEGPYRGSRSVPFRGPAIRYHAVPTLEEPWVPMPSPGNEAGGRMSATVKLKNTGLKIESRTAVLQYLGALNENEIPLSDDSPFIVHTVLAAEQSLAGGRASLELTAGMRFQKDTPAPRDRLDGVLGHGGIALRLHFDGEKELTIGSTFIHNDLNQQFFSDATLSLNEIRFHAGAGLVLFLHLDYSNELDRDFDNELELAGRPLALTADLFPRAGVEWTPAFLSRLTLRAQAGSSRGGWFCVDGDCHLHQDTVGAALDLVLRM